MQPYAAPPHDESKRASRAGTVLLAAAALGSALALGGCGRGDGSPKGGDAVEVGYVVARTSSVPLTRPYTGRVVAYQTAEVRPQVSGIVRQRLFAEGQMVEAGRALYRIDPSLYDAALREASAGLRTAEANRIAADELVDRYRPLAEVDAVSRQDFVNATAAARQAEAAVSQAAARLDTSRINLRFTAVPAPLSGRIGRSLVTVGGLAVSGQSDPLAIIQQIDPVYVDVQQSAAERTALRRGMKAGVSVPEHIPAEIILPDGSPYAHRGTLAFSEVTVDPSSGTVALRIRVPNPDHLLLPGMFVRALLAQSIESAAILVPQEGLRRNERGEAMVWLVGPGDKAIQRIVTADHTEGANWIVTGGLSAGDRVIVQGIGNLRADIAVRPVAAATPEQIGPVRPASAPARR